MLKAVTNSSFTSVTNYYQCTLAQAARHLVSCLFGNLRCVFVTLGCCFQHWCQSCWGQFNHWQHLCV